MAYRNFLLVIAFAVGVHTQNFGRSFDPTFGFRAPNSISFAQPRLPFASQPVTFNAAPSQNQFFSTSGSINANRIRNTRVPQSQNFGINFQRRPVAKEPSFITFGAPQPDPTISFSNVNSGAPITFGNVDGTPLLPSGPVSSPRVPDIETPSNVPPVAQPGVPVTSATGNQPEKNTSPIVFFPTQPVIPNQEKLSNGNNDECPLKDGLIFYKGNCSRLLSRGSCGADQWLVLSDDGAPRCADRACPWQQLEFQGDCVDPANLDVCPRGQILYVDFDGHAECDCEVDHYYDPDSGHCYTYHEQGPCQSNYYIEERKGGGVTCVPNPCEHDDKVLVEGKCHDKNYKGFCRPNLVMILPEDNSADCIFILPHSIFEVPTLNACPDGSRRDFLGKCRAVFRVASQTSLPSLRGDCPTNFIADPSGTCRRVVSLFG